MSEELAWPPLPEHVRHNPRTSQPVAGPRTGRLTGEPNQGSLARRGPDRCRLNTAG